MTSLDEKIVIGMSNMPRKQQNNHTPITESALVFLPESWYEEREKFEKDKWKKSGTIIRIDIWQGKQLQ